MYNQLFLLTLVICSTAVTGDINSTAIIEDLSELVLGTTDLDFDVEDYVNGYGYPFEEYEVETEDGYLLTVHRIPYGQNSSAEEGRPVALLMHGLVASSADFLFVGPNRSLALLLADEGYDVWLGNCRGNTFSRKHVTLDPDTSEAYWNFSFHEIGIYDLPAIISEIENVTGVLNISYVGHSQGCTIFYILTSLKPEYNDRILFHVSLAPALVTSLLGNIEVLRHTPLLTILLTIFCRDGSILQPICLVLISAFGGPTDQIVTSDLSTIVKAYPAGSSLKQLKHFLQSMETDDFRQYDYGLIGNLLKYKQLISPEYPLENVTVPVAIFNGGNDVLVSPPDIPLLVQRLPNVVNSTQIDGFNHLDFMIGRDAPSLVYSVVISLMNSYSGLGTKHFHA
ncbi:hypothetical protein NQ317_002274 [Molorchus minor]|uniref:Lipase n=1 Tax=Molorchus minor TaxID=1323400 RepID=A0ABQ9J4F0_9CUCU|nr:hypothetical protein NQ317_002274 [Molorchus minor]